MRQHLASIEKAILCDVCLGVPLGKIWFSVPASETLDSNVGKPDTYLFRGEQLGLMKSLYLRGQRDVTGIVQALCDTADRVLESGPYSVTKKSNPPPSGNPNDYQSFAKYWWPNPDSEDGLPYIRKDGEVNPACYGEDCDYPRLVSFSETTVLLALAAYLSDRKIYADRAVQLLDAWMLDDETKQTPHFKYGQLIPGKDAHRYESTIEARHLLYVTEAVRILESMNMLQKKKRKEIRNWYRELLKWMIESPQGQNANMAVNNISVWYDLQCMAYAQFLGEDELVSQIATNTAVHRPEQQISGDGSLLNELGRARPYDYIAFSVAAMALLGRAGDSSGIRIWDIEDSDGRNYQAAHDWLLKVTQTKNLIMPALNMVFQGQSEASGVPDREGLQEGFPVSQGEYLEQILDIGILLRGVYRLAWQKGKLVDEANKRVFHLEHENGKLYAELEELRGKYTAEETRMQVTLSSAREKTDVLAREYEQLKHRLEKEGHRLASLSTNNDRLVSDIARVGAERDELKRDLLEKEFEFQRVVQNLQKLESENAGLRSSRETMEASVANYETQISSMQAMLSTAQEKINTLLREHDELKQLEVECARLQEGIDQLQLDKLELSKGMQDKARELEHTQEKLHALHRSESVLQERIRSLQEDIDHLVSLNAESKKFRSGLAKLENERDKLRHDFLEKESEIQRLVNRLRKLEVENSDLMSGRKILKANIVREARNLADKLSALHEYADDLEYRYRKIVNSRTWRLMAPIRGIVRAFKSGGHRWKGTFGDNRVEKPNVNKVSAREVINSILSDKEKAAAEARKPKSNAAKRESAPESHEVVEPRTIYKNMPDPLRALHDVKPQNEGELKKEYRRNGLHEMLDTFILYRIIGNDLVPRHSKGQSRRNLRLVLENEQDLQECEKRWVVNRIVDAEEEAHIMEILESHRQKYIHIPFVPDEYANIGLDETILPQEGFLQSRTFRKYSPEKKSRFLIALYRRKNNYLMNNNGARNAALREGRNHAKWVLPWDGSCFVTARGWEDIRRSVLGKPYLKYFVVPMQRIIDNSVLIRDDFALEPIEEPQLIFRYDAKEEFNEEYCYGRRPKVELFWRLGIPGKWDRWDDDPWDQPRRSLSDEAYQFGVAGWVARMFCGTNSAALQGDSGARYRHKARQDSIISTINFIDNKLNVSANMREIVENSNSYDLRISI